MEKRHRRRLIEARAKFKKTQLEVAEAVGITRQYLAMIELGQRMPPTDLGLRIARYYGVPMEELFGDDVPRDVALHSSSHATSTA